MISFPEILLRLGIALLLGALVGLERETSEHAAGIRTNALVALGSALFTVISAFGFLSMLGIPHIQLDPTRIASYVVAGIGFLGGGAIFHREAKEQVKGLTTAAAIWVVAAIGMACGAGFLWEATVTTLLALIVLILLRFLERIIVPHRSSHLHHLRLELTALTGSLLEQIYETCTQAGIAVEKVSAQAEPEGESIHIICRVQDATTLVQTLGKLRTLTGVRAVHADLQGIDRETVVPVK
jgi:putative Mg2+ transporter-C (MgtC) family protein